MAFAQVGKVGASLGVVGGVVLAVASCTYRDHDRYRDCDYVETRCQRVCDYYCDWYSCYPTCWDQCWDECGQVRRRPVASSSSGSVDVPFDASSPPPIADGGAPSIPDDGGGSGVLCTSCSSNADCETGALCILRGGPPRDDADGGGPLGRGFCGAACTTSQDCPAGFLCSQMGATRQCLPTGNACE